MGAVREQSERLLQGREDPSFHPFTPLFKLEEVAERVAFVSSFANVLALDTDDGLVLVDTGSFFFARLTKELVRSFTARPLHTAVYTHGHVDHVFGVDLYEEESGRKARVVGHRAVRERFDRYRLTPGYNACINARQFQLETTWPTDYRYPDTEYDDSLVIDVGGTTLELFHARGETDDHTFAWVPSRKLLATGDLFIWATPNAGNPQKVQRYPRDWAAALRRMAALEPEVLSPGHGPPIFGREAIHLALTETAALLERLVDETLARMNEGATLDDVLASVRAPRELLERPYLRPIYDEPEFVVRNVWRQYGGWWDGNPAHLKPGPEAALARELCDLAGGAPALVDRALRLSLAGDHAVACHLVELAFRASPRDPGVRSARSRVYLARSEAETSLMAKGVFRTAARESE
ncbi:MAG: MBL fold metallo-hydrolase [Myxococcales bacterium]|nr:MBL fold metallo-hydrolase [Myxococcales bacterium]